MKNSLKLLSVVLLLTAGAWCQISGTISATSTDCSVANSCLTMNLPTSQSTGYSGLMVSVTPSSYSGVLTFEVSDGTTWTVRQGYASTDNSSGVTTSAAGSNLSYQFNVSGWLGFRVRGSSYTSGSVVVKINPSPGSASSGHGGGTGGAVSSVTGAGTVSCSPTTGSVTCTGSGATIAATTLVLKGDNAGNGIAATPGTDYVEASSLSTSCSTVGLVDTTVIGSPNTITCIDGGTSGYVLTSNGAGVLPTYQAPSAGASYECKVSIDGTASLGVIRPGIQPTSTDTTRGDGPQGICLNHSGSSKTVTSYLCFADMNSSGTGSVITISTFGTGAMTILSSLAFPSGGVAVTGSLVGSSFIPNQGGVNVTVNSSDSTQHWIHCAIY